MKSFICAIIILCAVSLLVFLNAASLARSSSEMLELLSQISIKNAPALDKYCSAWEAHVRLFSLTLPKQYIDRGCEGCAQMQASIKYNDPLSLERGVLICRRVLEEIMQYSSLNIDNIL